VRQIRRLAVILAADMAGYSRLVEADEESAGVRIHGDRPKSLSEASFELVRQRQISDVAIIFSNPALLLDEVAADTRHNRPTPS
jgi:hypothetical protein